MELENQFRYLVGGYYGVSLIDEYPLKEFVLKDIEEYIRNFVEINPIDSFDYQREAELVKENVSDRVKLQDALLVLNKIHGSMDLVFLIKQKLKQYERK
jgi:hypothetical protein